MTTATSTLEIERPSFDEMADDKAHLDALESLLMSLPDEAVGTSKAAAARFRLSMSAALRAMHGMLEAVAGYPADDQDRLAGELATAIVLRHPIERWREARAKIAERLK